MKAPSPSNTHALRVGGGPAATPGSVPKHRPLTSTVLLLYAAELISSATVARAVFSGTIIGTVSLPVAPGCGRIGLGRAPVALLFIVVSPIVTGGGSGDLPPS